MQSIRSAVKLSQPLCVRILYQYTYSSIVARVAIVAIVLVVLVLASTIVVAIVVVVVVAIVVAVVAVVVAIVVVVVVVVVVDATTVPVESNINIIVFEYKINYKFRIFVICI